MRGLWGIWLSMFWSVRRVFVFVKEKLVTIEGVQEDVSKQGQGFLECQMQSRRATCGGEAERLRPLELFLTKGRAPSSSQASSHSHQAAMRQSIRFAVFQRIFGFFRG